MTENYASFKSIDVPEPEPQLSAAQYFADSFASEADRQITGVSQLFGSDRKSRAEAPEADSFIGYHAQMLGRASADVVPIAVTALGLRFGLKSIFPVVERTAMLPRASALSINPGEAAATGFITSSAFKESDPETRSKTGAFIRDRFESGIFGGASLSILSGVSRGLVRMSENADTGTFRKIFLNPVANGIATGVPGGLLHSGFQLLLAGDVTGADVTKSIYEFSLTNALSAGLGSLGARRAQRIYDNRPQEIVPSFADDHFQGFDGGDEAKLGYRRYIRRTGQESALESKSGYEQWNIRADELTERISKRINNGRLTQDQFWSVLDSYPKEDQPIAKHLLERAAPLSTDYGLSKSLFTLGAKLQQDYLKDFRILTQGPASSGTMLGYLMRKTHMQEADLSFFGSYDPTKPIIFADLPNLSKREQEIIVQMAKTRPVTLADTDFDRLPNVLDFALSRDHVKAKLDTAIDATKTEMANSPGTTIEQAVDKILHGPTDAAFAKLVQDVGPSPKHKMQLLRPNQLTVDDSFTAVGAPEQTRKYLEQKFAGEPEQRIMAAEMMAEDVDFNSLGTLVKKMQQMRMPIEYSALRKGLDPANDIFAVAPGGGASSESFMTYLYARANNISPSRLKPLDNINTKKAEAGQRLVLVDDTIYSGDQMTAYLHSIDQNAEVAAAALTSYDKFAKNFVHEFPKTRELLTLQSDYSAKNSVRLRNSPYEERELLKDLFDGQGYRGVVSLRVYPHMTSDSSPRWLTEFTHKYLKIPNSESGYKSPWAEIYAQEQGKPQEPPVAKTPDVKPPVLETPSSPASEAKSLLAKHEAPSPVPISVPAIATIVSQ